MVKAESNRFQDDAAKYAAYLETPEGRLRVDLTLANLQEFLRPATDSFRVLDIGCGTGAVAVRLAILGLYVTLLDSSGAMLDLAQSAAQEAGVAEKVTVKLGDIDQLAGLFRDERFDLILCHNVLEYVNDPGAVLCSAMRLMRDSSSLFSVLVRNQPGEVLKSAIQGGDLVAATSDLTAEWGQESLYGGKVRLFASDSLRNMLKMASFEVVAERGVRVIADYLPPRVSRTDEYGRIFELERKLGSREEFAAIARYTHCLARLAP